VEGNSLGGVAAGVVSAAVGARRGWAYESGAFSVTTLRCAASDTGIQLSIDARRGEYAGMPAARPLLMHIYLPAPPAT